jgi:hypothetical protein
MARKTTAPPSVPPALPEIPKARSMAEKDPKPVFNVCVRPRSEYDRSSGFWHQIGVGFETSNGYSIRLDPGVVLSWNDGLDIRLFPRDKKESDS